MKKQSKFVWSSLSIKTKILIYLIVVLIINGLFMIVSFYQGAWYLKQFENQTTFYYEINDYKKVFNTASNYLEKYIGHNDEEALGLYYKSQRIMDQQVIDLRSDLKKISIESDLLSRAINNAYENYRERVNIIIPQSKDKTMYILYYDEVVMIEDYIRLYCDQLLNECLNSGQEFYVKMQVELEHFKQLVVAFFSLFIIVIGFTFNRMLDRNIIRPIQLLSDDAIEISKGNLDEPEIVTKNNDEIKQLTKGLVTALTGCAGKDSKDTETTKQETSSSTKEATTEATTEVAEPTVEPAQEQIVFRLADNQPADYPTTLGDLEFARLVEEKTNGRIKIEVYYGGQLGDEKSTIEQVQFGAIDFARVSLSPIAEFAKELYALQMPYIYRDTDHEWKVLDGPIGDELLKSVEKADLVGLTWYDSGSRNFYNSKREVKTIADLKGLKIRVQESQLMMGMVEALGASATPMAYAEVYSALQTGVIDGAENNWPSYISTAHYEVAKFITIDQHTMVPEIVIASADTMSKLSAEDQEIIKQAAKESTAFQKTEWETYSAKSIQDAKDAGCTITELDAATVAEFQAAVQPLYDEFGKDYVDLIKRIQETK